MSEGRKAGGTDTNEFVLGLGQKFMFCLLLPRFLDGRWSISEGPATSHHSTLEKNYLADNTLKPRPYNEAESLTAKAPLLETVRVETISVTERLRSQNSALCSEFMEFSDRNVYTYQKKKFREKKFLSEVTSQIVRFRENFVMRKMS